MKKLPADAFALYVALGEGRSYIAVAEALGVGRTTVTRRARAERWQQRVDRIDEIARARGDEEAATKLAESRRQALEHQRALHEGLREVVTPGRFKAMVAALMKSAVQKDNVPASKLLIERLLGKPRSEALTIGPAGLPEDLGTTTDVRMAASALVRAVVDGTLAPEDAQRAASLVEAARRAVESEELERRLDDLERRVAKARR